MLGKSILMLNFIDNIINEIVFNINYEHAINEESISEKKNCQSKV